MYCVSNLEATWECSEEKDVPINFKHKAKYSHTLFVFQSYDSKTNQSVVKAYPKTGRTH